MKRVIVITGCSSGVGMHTAIQMAKTGATVVATMRNLDKSAPLQKLADEAGVSLRIEQLDVQNEDSVNRAMRNIIEREGQIDVFVNNAGFGYVRALEQSSFAEIQEVFDVNYLGVVRCMKAVIPHMRERRQGHVVTVSSVGGLVGQPLNEVYCSAKFAVEGLVESLATYMEPFFNVKFSLIEPAGIRSEFVNRVSSDLKRSGGVPADDYAPVMRAYLEGSKRRGEFDGSGQRPEDVANVIVQHISKAQTDLRNLTSDAARELTGIKTNGDPTGNLLQTQIRKDFLGK